MKKAKINFWKKYKVTFYFMLFMLGALVFSCLTNDAASGVSLGLLLPSLAWIKDGKFNQELTADQIKELSKEDAVIYVKELNQFRIEKVAHDLQTEIEKMVPKEMFDKLQAKLDKLNDANEKRLEDSIKEVEEMGKEISKAIKEANKAKGLRELNSFELKLINTKTKEGGELVDVLKTHEDGKKFSFIVKGTFTGADVGTITDNIYSQRVPGIGQYAAAKLVLSNFFPVSPIQIDGNGTAVYEDWNEGTSTKNAAFIAEGATYPESEAKFTTYSIQIEKIGDSISMTYEAVRDFARFTRELSRFLTRNIQAVVNQALWNGTGVTPQFAGIYTRVDAFNAVAYSGPTTTTPDLLDLVKVLAKEIMDGKDDKYEVDFVFVDWDEYLELALEKDTTGRLIYPNGIPSVMGITLYPTSFVVANTLVIGDRRYVECIGDPNAIQIEMGFKSGDWEADKESMKGRVRTCLLIREADKDGFLKVTDIDAAITAITT
jgi:hypothetical protein